MSSFIDASFEIIVDDQEEQVAFGLCVYKDRAQCHFGPRCHLASCGVVVSFSRK
jgi:hypothetical protein